MSVSILTIGDHPDLPTNKLLNRPEETVLLSDKKQTLYDLAIKIKRKTRNKTWVVFINLFLACKDDEFQWQQTHAGIALLKFLRLMDVNHHVVLVTPYSFEQLMKMDSTNLIIATPSVSLTKPVFNRMYDFSTYTVENLQQLAEKTFEDDPGEYLPFEYKFRQDKRHTWANWWGIQQLWSVHKVVIDEKNSSRKLWELEGYPADLRERLKRLKNFIPLILYGHQQYMIKEYLHEWMQARNKLLDEKGDMESELEKIKIKIKEIEDLVNKRQKEKFQIHFLKRLEILHEKYKDSKRVVTELGNEWQNRLKETNKNEIKILYESSARYSDLRKAIKNISSKILPYSIQEMRILLQQKSKPKILLIDDQWKDGWSTIIQHMVYGDIQNDTIFKSLPESDYILKDPVEFYENVVFKTLKAMNPNILLLDLRLKNEKGTRTNVEDLSGAILFEKIRSEFKDLPVIIVTASNKFWSFEELQQINTNINKGGYFGYWPKEGIDAEWNEEDSIINYARLLGLITEALNDPGFKSLNELLET